MPFPSTPHAVIYARFSPRPDADESQSIEQQVEACRAYCARKGYAVRSVHADREASGSDPHRVGLWEAVAALKRGDVLVAHRRDRLARDLYLSEYIRRSAQKTGARVETVDGGSNGDSPQEVLLRQMLDAFAEFERKMIGIRTRAAMRRKQANGERMSSHAPYGWQVDPHDASRLAPEPIEAAVVATILRLRADGQSLRSIATTLDAQGAPCRGQRWRHQAVERIIRRETP